MKVFALKSCDTCRKALKELAAAGYDLQVVDLRADGVSAQEIAQFIAEFGEKALNKASTTWRDLPEDQKSRPIADLLADHPTLLKRPVIEQGGVWYQGWTPAVRAALIGTPK